MIRRHLILWTCKMLVRSIRACITLQVVILGPLVFLGTSFCLGSRVQWPVVLDTLAAWKASFFNLFI